MHNTRTNTRMHQQLWSPNCSPSVHNTENSAQAQLLLPLSSGKTLTCGKQNDQSDLPLGGFTLDEPSVPFRSVHTSQNKWRASRHVTSRRVGAWKAARRCARLPSRKCTSNAVQRNASGMNQVCRNLSSFPSPKRYVTRDATFCPGEFQQETRRPKRRRSTSTSSFLVLNKRLISKLRFLFT